MLLTLVIITLVILALLWDKISKLEGRLHKAITTVANEQNKPGLDFEEHLDQHEELRQLTDELKEEIDKLKASSDDITHQLHSLSQEHNSLFKPYCWSRTGSVNARR